MRRININNIIICSVLQLSIISCSNNTKITENSTLNSDDDSVIEDVIDTAQGSRNIQDIGDFQINITTNIDTESKQDRDDNTKKHAISAQYSTLQHGEKFVNIEADNAVNGDILIDIVDNDSDSEMQKILNARQIV